MDCPPPEVWLAWLESRLDPPERARWSVHLAACADCRGELAGWAEAVPEKSRLLLPYGLAAAALLALGIWGFRQTAPPPVPAPAFLPREASLEIAPGGDALLSGRTLSLRSGACWLDTRVPVELPVFGVRFEAGTEAEVRILPAPKATWSLLGEAWAGTPPEILVSVVSGSAQAGALHIPAGSRALLPSRTLEPLDASAIDAWRAALRDERTFSAEVRNVTGNLVLAYPAGETTLGDLPAWKDGAWHRISVAWRGSATEVFLDGRRILKLQASRGTGTPGLSVRGGTMEQRP